MQTYEASAFWLSGNWIWSQKTGSGGDDLSRLSLSVDSKARKIVGSASSFHALPPNCLSFYIRPWEKRHTKKCSLLWCLSKAHVPHFSQTNFIAISWWQLCDICGYYSSLGAILKWDLWTYCVTSHKLVNSGALCISNSYVQGSFWFC